jgi:hypothetical protein
MWPLGNQTDRLRACPPRDADGGLFVASCNAWRSINSTGWPTSRAGEFDPACLPGASPNRLNRRSAETENASKAPQLPPEAAPLAARRCYATPLRLACDPGATLLAIMIEGHAMTSIMQFQARIDSANRLLAKTDRERWRIAKLKYLAQMGIQLRQKYPELDVEGEAGKVGIPRPTNVTPPQSWPKSRPAWADWLSGPENSFDKEVAGPPAGYAEPHRK